MAGRLSQARSTTPFHVKSTRGALFAQFCPRGRACFHFKSKVGVLKSKAGMSRG